MGAPIITGLNTKSFLKRSISISVRAEYLRINELTIVFVVISYSNYIRIVSIPQLFGYPISFEKLLHHDQHDNEK